MTDPGNPDDRQEPGDEEEALLRFLAQFGIAPGPDGRLDIEQLLGRMQGMMSAFTTQMASFGKSDTDSGMNWGFTKDVVRRVTAAAGPDPAPTAGPAGQRPGCHRAGRPVAGRGDQLPPAERPGDGLEPRRVGRPHLPDLAAAGASGRHPGCRRRCAA